MSDVVATVGARLGWTPAQAWTAVPALAVVVPVVVATVLGVLGQPAPAPAAAVALPAPFLEAPLVEGPSVQASAQPGPAQPAPGTAAGPETAVPADAVPQLPPQAPPAFGVPLPGDPGGATARPADPRQPSRAPGRRPAGPAPAAQPLRVVDSGWSSSVGADPTLPAGVLPVQAGPSGETARSFVRLDGTATTLRLAVDDRPGSGYGGAVAGVRACPNLDDRWASGGGQSPSAAPPVDGRGCVVGVLADGVATFDLRGFIALATAGLSLLPDPAGPAPYRVAFQTSLEDS